MKDRLISFFNRIDRAGKYGTTNSSLVYIVDRKEEQQGSIEILDEDDRSINGLLLKNDPQISLFYYAFEENSFRLERYNKNGIFLTFAKGNQYRQCECVLFPDVEEDHNDWLMLIELKYVLDYSAASRKNSSYPQQMIEQIIQTTEYLRRHNVISINKKIHAVLSFPNVIEDFNSTLFEGDIFIEDESKIDIRKSPTSNVMNRTQIAIKYNVHIRAQNEATIKSASRLKFT